MYQYQQSHDNPLCISPHLLLQSKYYQLWWSNNRGQWLYDTWLLLRLMKCPLLLKWARSHFSLQHDWNRNWTHCCRVDSTPWYCQKWDWGHMRPFPGTRVPQYHRIWRLRKHHHLPRQFLRRLIYPLPLLPGKLYLIQFGRRVPQCRITRPSRIQVRWKRRILNHRIVYGFYTLKII